MSKRVSNKLSSFHDEEIVVSSPESITMVLQNGPQEDDGQFDEGSKRKTKGRKKSNNKRYNRKSSSSSYPVDPWETTAQEQNDRLHGGKVFFPSTFSDESGSMEIYDEDNYQENEENDTVHEDPESNASIRSTFLVPSDIHPRMEHREDDIAQLRLLAGKLNADWGGQDFMAPALARRIRDFQFAQEKRRKKYGDERPWGILGLYDHLASIR
jgi:hypothetical protein